LSYNTSQFDDHIVALLKNGGVGLLPSDTIYGLSCRALDAKAVERVHKLKGRDGKKSFVLLVSNISQLEELGITENDAAIIKDLWPGPVSVIFEAPQAPKWLSRDHTLAVRLPANEGLCSLISQVGPLVSTSANLHGRTPAETVEQARALFGEHLDFYIDAGIRRGNPSTIVKITNGKMEIIRQGAYKLKK
jgi:L-threonylcarbamoyladenylate synthase